MAAVLALAFLGLYLATQPANRTEAEDAYDYAWSVEHLPARELWHPHHWAYAPAMKAAFDLAKRGGLADRAFPVMVAVGAAAAAASVGLVFLLLRGPMAAPRGVALPVALAYGLSYGTWRYAAEAEIYAVATAPAVLLLLLARRGRRARGAADGTVLGTVAALAFAMHALNAIPAFAVAALLAWRREWRRLAFFAGAAVAVLGTTWLLLAPPGAAGELTAAGAPVSGLHRFRPAQWARAAVGLGQNLVSATGLLGSAAFRSRLAAALPAQQLAEEFFLGERLPSWLVRAAAVTLVLALAALAATAWRALRGTGSLRRHPGAAGVVACGAWFVLHACVVFRFDPVCPEYWVQALAPLWLAIGGLLAAGVTGDAASGGGAERGFGRSDPSAAQTAPSHHGTPNVERPTPNVERLSPLPASGAPFEVRSSAFDVRRSLPHVVPRRGLWVWALPVCLGLHNLVGGLLPLWSRAGDYNAAKAAWVAAEADPGDLVLTAGGPVFFRHLRYHARAETVHLLDLDDAALAALSQRVGKASGRVFVLGDALDVPASLRAKFPEAAARAASWAGTFRPRLDPVRRDAFGGVFELQHR